MGLMPWRLINRVRDIRRKLKNWCFNCWISFGNKAGWIKYTRNNLQFGMIFCNLPLKNPSKEPFKRPIDQQPPKHNPNNKEKISEESKKNENE